MIIGPFWWLLIPGLLLGLYAQYKLSQVYKKYIQAPVSTGLTGAQAAREILDRSGLREVPIREVSGHLSDHYDPMKRALCLSSENYHGRSLAALGVAAHEAGHALQHKAAYAPLKIRMALVPITGFASQAVFWVLILGILMNLTPFVWAGVGLFAVITLFQLVTLPVEFDASKRAKQQLVKFGLIQQQEITGVTKVLNAAALTYVAAMVQSLFTLLQFILIARGEE